MIKLTHHETQGRRSAEIHIAHRHLVSIEAANPSGALIITTRGAFHVAQSVEQVLTLTKGKI